MDGSGRTCAWGSRCGVGVDSSATRIAERWLKVAGAAHAEGRPAPTRYVFREKKWVDATNGDGGYARAITETVFELAMFCTRKRRAREPRTDWEGSLFEILAWYTHPDRRRHDGLLPLRWDRGGHPEKSRPVTAGAPLIAALAEASALPGGRRWLPVAQELMEAYARRFLGDMPSHPGGSALDSGCEDMESGMFLLVAANALRRAEQRCRVRNALTLERGMQAADWVLTWAYTWNVPVLPGTLLHSLGYASAGMSDVSVQNRCLHPFSSAAALAELGRGLNAFQSRGMSDVSVQNRHLHVFSSAAEIGRLARNVGESGNGTAGFYEIQAQRMLAPLIRTIARPGCRWGTDEDGEQCEQYNQTNYVQHPWDPVCRPRGGIARWFVPWMTVWVLSVCLDFLEE